ncbi:MAG: hypothetical protein B6242_08555 [Anaerolineaceae bacterium 4572_78]|nr:MAG: hypothetical protein B6242_08555 [Anaerolineaceae bacterium 4572_78]
MTQIDDDQQSNTIVFVIIILTLAVAPAIWAYWGIAWAIGIFLSIVAIMLGGYYWLQRSVGDADDALPIAKLAACIDKKTYITPDIQSELMRNWLTKQYSSIMDTSIQSAKRQLNTLPSSPQKAEIYQVIGSMLLISRSGNHSKNIEEAMQYYDEALKIFTRQQFPNEWATIQNDLAVYYATLSIDQPPYLQKSIEYFNLAFEFRNQNTFPFQWAWTNYFIGQIYHAHISSDEPDNLQKAIYHYQQALETFSTKTHPELCRLVAIALGNIFYYHMRDFSEAQAKYTTFHESIKYMRGKSVSLINNSKTISKNATIYTNLVHASLLVGDVATAFEHATFAQGRDFVIRLAGQIKPNKNYKEFGNELEQISDVQDKAARIQLDLNLADYSVRDVFHQEKLQKNKEKVQELQSDEILRWNSLHRDYPALTASQNTMTISLDDACELASALRATIVNYYRFGKGCWCAFLVQHDGVQYVHLPELNDSLIDDMTTWVYDIEIPTGVGRSPNRYKRQTILYDWYLAVIDPLNEYIDEEDERLVIAPFGKLHLLPFAVACNPDTHKYAMDEYTITVTPNIGMLYALWKQEYNSIASQHADHPLATTQPFLVVASPGDRNSENYFPHVLPEADMLAKYIGSKTKVLKGNAATSKKVLNEARNRRIIHFGHHGDFQALEPNTSGLYLAGGILTIQKIIEELWLERTYLVTLSTCRREQIAYLTSEEYIGLHLAMMAVGARVMVTGLWNGDELLNRRLLFTFYKEIISGKSPAIAMKTAMRHVHDINPHPYYWASYNVTGFAHHEILTGLDKNTLADVDSVLPYHNSAPSTGNDSNQFFSQPPIITLAQLKRSNEILLEGVLHEQSNLNPSEQSQLQEKIEVLLTKLKNVITPANFIRFAIELHNVIREIPHFNETLFEPDSPQIERKHVRKIIDKKRARTLIAEWVPHVENYLTSF